MFWSVSKALKPLKQSPPIEITLLRCSQRSDYADSSRRAHAAASVQIDVKKRRDCATVDTFPCSGTYCVVVQWVETCTAVRLPNLFNEEYLCVLILQVLLLKYNDSYSSIRTRVLIVNRHIIIIIVRLAIDWHFSREDLCLPVAQRCSSWQVNRRHSYVSVLRRLHRTECSHSFAIQTSWQFVVAVVARH